MQSVPNDYIAHRLAESHLIPFTRRDCLRLLVDLIEAHLASHRTTRLVFICTHNSRRSQIAQVWARAAADHFSISSVEAYSAGTETTAFNERAIAALRRAGFAIERRGEGANPVYECRFGRQGRPLTFFSKDLSDRSLPESFTAVMTCSAADAACPTVYGASARLSLPYDDPKGADDSPEETTAYDECCRQISRDLLHLFSQITR